MSNENQTTAIAVDQRKAYADLSQYLISKRTAIANVAPKYLDTEEMIRISLGAVSRNPRLLQCTPQSWIAALMDCAFYGLAPNPVLGHAYLVPYQNKKVKGHPFEVTVQIGYKGLILLACEHGGFEDVDGRIVYGGEIDDGRFEETPEDPLKPFRHRPIYEIEKRGEIAGAYAVGWRGLNKRPKFRYLTKSEIELYRSRSRAASDGPWVTDWNAMAMKTAVRRMLALAQLRPGSKLGTALEQESALERDEVIRAQDWQVGDDHHQVGKSKADALTSQLVEKAKKAKETTAPVEKVAVEEIGGDPAEGQSDLPFVP